MLLSHSRKFIFVHIYKTGGTSLRTVLAPLAAPRIGRVAYEKLGKPQFLSRYEIMPCKAHATAEQIREKIGESLYENYFSFAIVRNPWDLQCSLYAYMMKKQSHPEHKFIKTLGSFEEYISWRCARKIRLQKEFVCDSRGKLIVDYLGKLETLTDDFMFICKSLKVSANLPHVNRSSERHYREYYNTKSRDLVNAAFRDDINFFKYEF